MLLLLHTRELYARWILFLPKCSFAESDACKDCRIIWVFQWLRPKWQTFAFRLKDLWKIAIKDWVKRSRQVFLSQDAAVVIVVEWFLQFKSNCSIWNANRTRQCILEWFLKCSEKCWKLRKFRMFSSKALTSY